MDKDNFILISLSRDDFQSLVIDSVNSCLRHSNTVNENKMNEEELLNITGVSNLLSLKKPTIYGLVHKGIIPHHKKRGRLYFLRAELIEWVKSGRRKTIDEIESEPEQFLKPVKKRRS